MLGHHPVELAHVRGLSPELELLADVGLEVLDDADGFASSPRDDRAIARARIRSTRR
jgi:hypothetical protein